MQGGHETLCPGPPDLLDLSILSRSELVAQRHLECLVDEMDVSNELVQYVIYRKAQDSSKHKYVVRRWHITADGPRPEPRLCAMANDDEGLEFLRRYFTSTGLVCVQRYRNKGGPIILEVWMRS
jgi:hypothetical protein